MFLCIDTCTNVCSIAVVTKNMKILSERLYNYKLKHSEILIPEIESMLKELELSMDDITRVYVTNGPGSFTGIRIGVTVANTISQVKDIPVYSICLLDLLAEAFRFLNGIIISVIYARADKYFYSIYNSLDKTIEKISEYKMGDIEKIITSINDIDKNIFVAGDILEEHKNMITKKALFSDNYNKMPRASILPFVDIIHGSLNTEKYAVPLYLEKSQAEKNLMDIKNE